MKTKIAIGNQLLDTALKMSGLKTKEDVVEEALKHFIQLKRQAEIKAFRGKLKWEGDLEQMRLNG